MSGNYAFINITFYKDRIFLLVHSLSDFPEPRNSLLYKRVRTATGTVERSAEQPTVRPLSFNI